jgi:sulfite reductase (NADPH) hemoprotein beta-component
MDDPAPRLDRSAPLAELHSNERLKHDSRYLRGTLERSLADAATGAVDDDDALLTKFFGIYQQDDRDLRDERRRAKLEPRYQFMVRVRLPGGVCTPAQWLALDALAREHADGALRLTTRQTFQFHGIRKSRLRAHLRGLEAMGLDTVAACGDDNRNVIATANPAWSPAHAAASALAKQLSDRLLPRTGAYREIFLGEPPSRTAVDEEPLYGATYLPRKFKIAIAVPPDNDVDVLAHDLGFVAEVREGKIVAYNVYVGGGMGMTHNVTTTFPRLAEALGCCAPEDVLAVAEHTLCIQRDFGNRKDRARARFKYTIEDRGVAWFHAELARRLGRPLGPARPVAFETSMDRYGWRAGPDGRWHYTLFVESGRVIDRPGCALQSGLRAIAAAHTGLFALTTNQNVVIAGVPPEGRGAIDALLEAHGIANEPRAAGLRAHALACVALPTCGLAMAESERYLPTLLGKLDALLAAAGLGGEPISIRMSGCPNGCSRPYLAEIALVGKAPGRYNLYLGGNRAGERLNALYRETLDEEAILEALSPLFRRYAAERSVGEAFGDFVVRAGIVRAIRFGREFQRG